MASGLLSRPSQTANFRSSRHMIHDTNSALHRNPSFNLHFSSNDCFKLSIKCQPFSWIPVGRWKLLKSARSNHLRQIILNASNEELRQDSERGKSVPRKQLNLDKALAIGEALCITAATSIFIASGAARGSQESRLVSSTSSVPLLSKCGNIPAWQNFFLLAALIINAILRARQWQGRNYNWSAGNKLAVVGSTFESRFQKLEDDLGSTITIVRVLSKQLEKLGVRFRVTRQTLRDPIQETAVLAQKTSESVSILAAREDAFEKDLEEIQYALHGMQENQTKQLELISALGKLLKERTNGKVEKPTKGASVYYEGKQKLTDRTVNLENTSTRQAGLSRGQGNGRMLESKREYETASPVDHENHAPKAECFQVPERVDYWLNSSGPSSDRKMEGQSLD